MALRLLSIFAAFVLLMGGASFALPGRERDLDLEAALRGLGIALRLPADARDVTYLLADHRALRVEFALYGARYALTAEREDCATARDGALSWRAGEFLLSLRSPDASEEELRALARRMTI